MQSTRVAARGLAQTPTSNSSIAIRNFGMFLLNNQWQPDRRWRSKNRVGRVESGRHADDGAELTTRRRYPFDLSGNEYHGARLPESTDQPEWNDAKDGELMAALIAIDTKQPAKRESDKKRVTQFEREVASEGASEQSETISDAASDAEVFSTPASRICRTRKFTAYRNPIAVGIAAFVSIAAVLSIAWHFRDSSIHSNRPSASTTQSRQQAVPSTGQSSPTGGSAVAIGTPMTADAPQRSNVVPDSAVSATPKVKTSNGTLSSPKGALAQAKSGKLNELNAGKSSRQKFCRNLCHPFLRGRKGSTWTGLYNSTP